MNATNILIIFLTLAIFFLIYIITSKNRKVKNAESQESQNIQNQLNSLREDINKTTIEQRREVREQLEHIQNQLSQGMRHSQTSIQKQFSDSSKLIKEVTEKLTTLDSTNKQVLDFSSQLKNLQDILKNPKQRGVLGEYWLETLLSNMLAPETFKMQYKIGEEEKTGKTLIADAVIIVRGRIIPIDAKFSLENYNRMMEEHDSILKEKIEKQLKSDVKLRIDETSKYIKPEFNTMDFAFMFIPAEGVYYNLLNAKVGSGINSQNLVEYAFSKHVMIVSPTSLYAYLQTVLMGLRELKLEKSTQEIIKRVGELGKHIRSYAEYHEKLGKNLGIVVNQYNLSGKELKKISKDTVKITSGNSEDILETELIEKPLNKE